MNTLEWSPDRRGSVFDEIPSGILVIDRARTIVDHNRAFAGLFGEARGRPCHEVLHGHPQPCSFCPAEVTFREGKEQVLEQTGRDRDGRPIHYLVQLTALPGSGNGIDHVAAITTDLTPTRRLQREYQILFEKVPCFVALINRDYRVVRANQRFRDRFGEPAGEYCYRLFKHRRDRCRDCPVEQTFRDGDPHTIRNHGVGRDGSTTHYVAFTAPVGRDEGETSHVIHMSLDVTHVHQLEAQLSEANAMRRTLVANSLDSILVFDERQRIQLANRAAEELWGYPRGKIVGGKAPPKMIPAGLTRVLEGKTRRAIAHEARIVTSGGTEVPVRAAAFSLDEDGKPMGSAVIAHDLTEVKRLGREKLDAERLAAVGQTVAGLAHGIKNILTGLEGGMYVMSSGLKKGDDRRMHQGWEMLDRNMGRISALAKNLLAFSRGDKSSPRLVRPWEVVRDVVNLYRESTEQHGIELRSELDDFLEPAWLDPEGIHSCLANLISNAMDACLVSQNPDCSITVRLREKGEAIVMEVEDTGCGMDYEVKQKAFTSFFTTKRKGGTGIGLLITRKIVQQHGGSVTVRSTPGEGAVFRLEFPRDRLPHPETKEDSDE